MEIMSTTELQYKIIFRIKILKLSAHNNYIALKINGKN